MFVTEQARKNAEDVDMTHNRLLTKITEIHAANNWILDWNDTDQMKYWVAWDHACSEKECASNSVFNHGNPVMCIQARDFMMSDQVSDDEFKAYLKIYN